MFALDVQDQILDKLHTLIVVLNTDGSVDYVSRSAQQLLGYGPQDLIGNNWWEMTRASKPEGELVKQKILQALNTQQGSARTFEHELRTAAGGKKWVHWNVSYLNDTQLIGVGYDVTDKKLNEKRLIDNNRQLLQQNKDITDSIRYALRIQQSILQPPEILDSYGNGSFLLYKPKDIVSGDYYWFHETEQFRYVAAVDCTGHGVPGAMMSMVANSIFKEVFLNQELEEPAAILKALDRELGKAIRHHPEEAFSDGMDVALIRIDKRNMQLTFAGAFRSMMLVRDSVVQEIKGSRYPIGFYSDIEKHFDTYELSLQCGDCLYLYTDGFIDQFGGEKDKKLNKLNFKELLKTIYDMNMEEQEAFLDYAFQNWKQDKPQTDDVCVIGLRI